MIGQKKIIKTKVKLIKIKAMPKEKYMTGYNYLMFVETKEYPEIKSKNKCMISSCKIFDNCDKIQINSNNLKCMKYEKNF